MTTKERLHELVDVLTEQEASDVLRLAAARHEGRAVDLWGDLDAQTDALFTDAMRDLAREERAAGGGSWQRKPDAQR